jgi:mannose/fructose/N-acetylgalactosamine-specific phosphotransferase system component IID
MQKKLLTIAFLALALSLALPVQAQQPPRTDYETVAASQTNQVCGPVGGTGDVITRLVITVATAATAATSLKDGSLTAVTVLPNSPGGGIGVYVVDFGEGMRSTSGAWQVTTGAGATAYCVGRFR